MGPLVLHVLNGREWACRFAETKVFGLTSTVHDMATKLLGGKPSKATILSTWDI